MLIKPLLDFQFGHSILTLVQLKAIPVKDNSNPNLPNPILHYSNRQFSLPLSTKNQHHLHYCDPANLSHDSFDILFERKDGFSKMAGNLVVGFANTVMNPLLAISFRQPRASARGTG
jgi:hypothetical protein